MNTRRPPKKKLHPAFFLRLLLEGRLKKIWKRKSKIDFLFHIFFNRHG